MRVAITSTPSIDKRIILMNANGIFQHIPQINDTHTERQSKSKSKTITMCSATVFEALLRWIIDFLQRFSPLFVCERARAPLHSYSTWTWSQFDYYQLPEHSYSWHEHCRKQLNWKLHHFSAAIRNLLQLTSTNHKPNRTSGKKIRKRAHTHTANYVIEKKVKLITILYLHIHMIWNKTNGPWHNSATMRSLWKRYTAWVHTQTQQQQRQQQHRQRSEENEEKTIRAPRLRKIYTTKHRKKGFKRHRRGARKRCGEKEKHAVHNVIASLATKTQLRRK